MQIEEIKKYIKLLQDSGLKKIVLKTKDFDLELESQPQISLPQAASLEAVSKKELPKPEDEIKKNYITSPMVGTFYAASAPNQPPFVKLGDQVAESSIVCIIEAMKVMNEVKAGKKGIVKEILVENSHPVEYGTKLFVIE